MALPLIAQTGQAAPDFLALVADDVTREGVRQAAAQFGWPLGRVRDGGIAAARAYLETSPAPAILLVDVSDCDDVLAAMDRLAEVCDAHTRVVAIGTVNDIALYRGLMQLGVSDYLVKPLSADTLAEALRRAERSERPAPTSRPSRTVALIGARGGVGATSLAVSLAWGLAHEQQLRTVLLDLDLQFGAAALSLDLETGRGLRELLAHPERIDSLLIGSAVSPESERLRILGAEESLEAQIDLGPEGLEALVATLSEGADVIVMDTPRRLDALSRAALAQADVVGVVTDLSLPAMRDAQRLLKLLGATRPEGEVLLIGARVGGVAGEVPRSEFERATGRALDFAVPFDAKAAAAAAEQGKSLLAVAKPGPTATELRRLVGRFAGGAPTAAAEKPSWLTRVLGK
ncbi:MAG: pilus assembly protein CpaE [Phenylobacterium sp.]|nr:pilus assembly protein CpaE [Phenylobacterium sp.]